MITLKLFKIFLLHKEHAFSFNNLVYQHAKKEKMIEREKTSWVDRLTIYGDIFE